MTTPAPRQLAAGERPSLMTLRSLFALQIELEQKWASGPWDTWDGRLLEQWREDVKQALTDAFTDLDVRMTEAERNAGLRELVEGEIHWLRARAVVQDEADHSDVGDWLAARAAVLQHKLDESHPLELFR